MSNSFIMTESIVRPAKMPYGRLKDNGFVGIEGEHAARALVVETKDDLSAFASINLIIDDLDCGAMTKATSGGTTTLSKVLTSSMIGRSGRKICQLIMVNSGNTVVQKSSQFEAYVGRANEIERSVDDGVTIIILSEAVTEMAREAAAAAAQEAAADVVEECQEIADAASASAGAAAQSAQEAEEAAASIVVDATLDSTSTHAIQNKVVASAISEINESLDDVKADLGDVTERYGINLLPTDTVSKNIGGISFLYENGILTRNGTATVNTASCLFEDYVIGAGTYTFWSNNASFNVLEIRRTSDQSLISQVNGSTKTFTLSEDTNVYILARVTSGTSYANAKAYIQMEMGESATTWESTANTAIDLTSRADITRNTADITRNTANITRNTANITRNTADILYIKGETGTFETESVSEMYNGNSELKTETDILKFYKAEIPVGLSEIVFTQENAGTNYAHWYNEYDENDNLIYAVTLQLSDVTGMITVHDPDTVSYIKISMWTGNGALTLAYNIPSLIDGKISERMGTSQYSHVSALGDSITNGLYYFNNAQAYTDNTYQKLLAEHFGATFQKLGINSTSISTQSNYESSANAFVNRYTQIAENADLIIVAGGTNDWGHNTPMGNITDTTDVGFYGALDVLINGLISHYPFARIIFVTPFQRDYSSGVYDPDTNQNEVGLTLKDYCDAIKQKCTQYGLQCVDGYAESGLNKTAVCKTNFAPDGLHPNPNGHAKIYANLLHALV